VPVSCPEPSFHRYLDLPPDLLALLSTFLNQLEIHQLNRALVGFYLHYFKMLPPVTAVTVAYPLGAFLHRQFKLLPREAKLLNAVVNADYEQVEEVLNENPALIFKMVNFVYRDGRSECTSPLAYAFKVYDTGMWRMAYEKIKDRPAWVAEFLKQAQEQTQHLDLAPLFAAGDELRVQRQFFLQNKITEIECDAAWYKYGAAQKKYLPVHMLKVFSRAAGAWSVGAHFCDDRPALKECQVYDASKMTWRPLISILSDPGWGVSFALFRGGQRVRRLGVQPGFACMRSGGCNASYADLRAELDILVYRHLFKVRSEDLAKHLAFLSPAFYKKEALQNQSRLSL